jgi:dGTPase
MPQLKWADLMSETRRKSIGKPRKQKKDGEHRTETERDFDRILFSTPVRRLADKTQVFPLEKIDSVRTRLTHSHEVSNLARSVGIALVYGSNVFEGYGDAGRNIPAMLATVGLAHDIGNPPFGHQGEQAIGSWFELHEADVFGDTAEKKNPAISSDMRLDYLKFEGNAQALRILTKLQLINDEFGLNLTCGSLAALMKYPVYSHETDDQSVASKKFGCFHSERKVCEQIWEETGLRSGVRHPLAFIMEACDDIAYSVLDVEDAVKKEWSHSMI